MCEYPLPNGREISLIMCMQMAFFGTLKDLLDSPINGGGGGAGPLYPLSYATDNGVTRICQRGEK